MATFIVKYRPCFYETIVLSYSTSILCHILKTKYYLFTKSQCIREHLKLYFLRKLLLQQRQLRTYHNNMFLSAYR